MGRPKGTCTALHDTGDPWLNLWAAVLKLAIEDARAGDAQAAQWLAKHDPELAGAVLSGRMRTTPTRGQTYRRKASDQQRASVYQ